MYLRGAVANKLRFLSNVSLTSSSVYQGTSNPLLVSVFLINDPDFRAAAGE